ncbi:MAG: hypothetical protein JOZ72_11610 [Alphaproteobacteria bacterium]|nr:hypothetical protein [Alphaproteobacteria bacterium]
MKLLKLNYICADVYGDIVVKIASERGRFHGAISTRKALKRRANVSFRPQLFD